MNTTTASPALATASAVTTAGVLPLIARVSIAAIFILSGLSKLGAPAGTIGYIASAGLPLPEAGYAIALLVEIVGGLLLAIGYRTRFVAAALALFTVAAAIFFHNALGDQNQFIHFFKNLAIAGGLLQVVAYGAGRISFDKR
ncbi:DoxX family protein [Sphingomonas koreensis]|uniref:DoxX family protein n=1 Tax=Sphingomonas koreensis TaxID=93064 RepID=UPI000831CEF6|nr:DoxX family protein [Sphingomonas koreensis]PJI90562.1 putative oxidoreductase [Sphingomonas koreensis]RSU59061.1 DoxX family protein [Sphingomonas koreensis]RSU67614.1 DoxX family protein [Sphingomonas koreensis]